MFCLFQVVNKEKTRKKAWTVVACGRVARSCSPVQSYVDHWPRIDEKYRREAGTESAPGERNRSIDERGGWRLGDGPSDQRGVPANVRDPHHRRRSVRERPTHRHSSRCQPSWTSHCQIRRCGRQKTRAPRRQTAPRQAHQGPILSTTQKPDPEDVHQCRRVEVSFFSPPYPSQNSLIDYTIIQNRIIACNNL